MPDAPVETPDSADGSWRLVSGSIEGSPIVPVPGWDVTMDVDGTRVGGRAACNSYGGTVEAGEDGSFAVGELSWTEMACEPDVMDVEQAVLRALLAVTSFELADGRLTVQGADAVLSFETVAPVPVADIVGTTWVLDSYLQGDAASSLPSMGLATLRLDADGALVGSTGCRRLEGEWIEAGAEIVFTSFSAIDDPAAGACPPDAERLDGLIISVLGDGFSAVVDGDRLTVMSQGGDGLSYTSS